ncbi:MAG: 3-deoxy-7-phosphoheptulonate synthase [Christensenellaceae bacterium]|jgi:3-deoxy-7-phosphoheptulonate synthase|nr:3-deoxy-7-phosphoheptulonate synthase [Christensenellaceae bacterium]
MILVIKQNHDVKQLDNLIGWISGKGLKVNISHGDNTTILGLVGDTTLVDIELLESLDIVESVKRIQEPYKKANRRFHPDDSVIDVKGNKFGGGHFSIIAGPCSVESEKQIIQVAEAVKAAGAGLLRGGAFKPRTSPYAFQGMREEGLTLLLKAKEVTGLPIVTEIMDEKHLDLFRDVDIIQVGARNMQNFELLKQLGKVPNTILLKRGLSNTIEELLMSAEYIMAEGNTNVILCERGIRTFEKYTRNTLDISAVPILHERSHLPVIIDPSHAAGIASLVEPLSLATAGVGADGLIIEVHNDPPHALCDGAQSIRPEQFASLVTKIKGVLNVVGKTYN